jgi:hypothetical protein
MQANCSTKTTLDINNLNNLEAPAHLRVRDIVI